MLAFLYSARFNDGLRILGRIADLFQPMREWVKRGAQKAPEASP